MTRPAASFVLPESLMIDSFMPTTIPNADSMPCAATMDLVRARIAKESTATHLTVVSDIFSPFGF